MNEKEARELAKYTAEALGEAYSVVIWPRDGDYRAFSRKFVDDLIRRGELDSAHLIAVYEPPKEG